MSAIHKGDRVTIRPEWRDSGDELFLWIAIEDEDEGRVAISPTNTGLVIAPWQTVNTYMLEAKQ